MTMLRPVSLVLAMTALAFAGGCGGGCCDGAVGEGPTTDPVAAFLLEDVNDTSPTFQQMVSPRDHLGRISAWYFGQSG